MSEKRDAMLAELKSIGMVSLRGERVLGHKQGAGEIQPWYLMDKEENVLTIYNDCVSIDFDAYAIASDKKTMTLTKGENIVLTFKFPSPRRLIENHNTLYVEDFAVAMEEALTASVESKGDWFAKFGSKPKVFTDDAKKNISQIKVTASKDDVKKACIDAANYLMMCYFLFEEQPK